METNIPQDILHNNSIRSYTLLDKQGDILCHYERQPHPNDKLLSQGSCGKTAHYEGQWVDLTEQAIAKSCSRTKPHKSVKAAATEGDIQLPIRLRAVEPDEVANFLLRHQDQLDIVTVTDKDK